MSIFTLTQRSAASRTLSVVGTEPQAVPLTKREREVAALIGEGLEIKEIAHELGIGYQTTKMHIRGVKGKLGVRNQLEIAILMHGGGPVPWLGRSCREVITYSR